VDARAARKEAEGGGSGQEKSHRHEQIADVQDENQAIGSVRSPA
jgi:hypothetical protein